MTAARTYGSIERMADGWMITAVEPHVALKLKAVFPRIPRTGRPPFHLRGGHQLDADLLWFLSRYPMRISEADAALLAERKTLFDAAQVEVARILAPDWRPTALPRFRDGLAPYPYQMQAAELARRKGRLLLLDDVGLGKTVSALAAICDEAYLPAAVVVQPHLAAQWAEEYVRAFTYLTPHVIRSTRPYELPPADVYIWRYSNIGGWVDFAGQAPFRSIVLDEVQELRHGRATGKGAAVAEFAASPAVTLKMGLSATPIYNYGSEIFNVLEPIEAGALGSWTDFLVEWCSPVGAGKWKVKEPDALGTYLREQHLALRRLEEDVGDQMPPVNTLIRTVPFDAQVAADADALARQLALTVTSGSFTERGQAARELNSLLRHTTGVAKARHVAAFVEVLLDAGTPVLLVGWHREVYDIWLEALARFRPALYTGSETTAAKKRAKDAFVRGATPLLIMSLRSGVGLDGLQQRCATVVFGELDWSPQVHRQVIGRLRRPGQRRQVDAIYLVCDGGSDPALVEALGLKASQARAILDPMAAPERQVSDESRIRRLAEMYLAGARIEVDEHAAAAALAQRPAAGAEQQLPLLGEAAA